MSLFDRWRPDRQHSNGSSPVPVEPVVVPEISANTSSESPEEWYRRLVELSPDGIVLHQDGRVIYANRAVLQMAGYADDYDIVGASITAVLPQLELPKLLQAAEGRAPERSNTTTVTLQRRDDQSIPVEITSAQVIHRGRPATQSMLRDISPYVERERLLKMQSRTAEVLADLHARLLSIGSRPELFEVAGSTVRSLFEATGMVLLRHTADDGYVHFEGESIPPGAVDILCEVATRALPAPTNDVFVVAETTAAGLTASQVGALEKAGVRSFMMATHPMVVSPHGVTAITFDQASHPSLENVEGLRLVLNAMFVAAQRVASMDDVRLSEERFRDAVEANPAGFAILAPVLDPGGMMIDAEYAFANAAMHEVLERACGKPDVKLYSHVYTDPAQFTAGMERFRTSLRRGERTESISREDFPGGPERWVRRLVVPTANGNLTVTIRDITADIRAQQAVEDAEDRFKAAAESNPGAFFILQPVDGGADYTVDFANQAAHSSFLQHAPDEDIRLADIVGRDSFAATRDACRQVLASGQPLDDAVRHSHPGEHGPTWYRRRIAVHGERLFVTYEDITEDRRRDAESRRNFELLRAAADSNRDSFMLLEPIRDADGEITDFAVVFQNRRSFETRVPGPYNEPRTLREILYYDDQHYERVLQEFVEAFERGESIVKEVAWDYNGATTWFERHLSTTAGVLTVVYRDITGFRREIDDLGAAEADRRAVLEGLSDMIIVADSDSHGAFRVSYANAAVRGAIGNVEGKHMADVGEMFDASVRDLMTTTRADAVASRGTRDFDYEGQFGGRHRQLNVAVTPVFDASGGVVRVIWRATDLTAQREASRRLVAAAEANPDAFLIMDPIRDADGEVTDFAIAFENEGAREIRRTFGGGDDASCLSEMVAAAAAPFGRVLADYRDALSSGQPRNDELSPLDPDGRQRHYQRHLLPMGDCVVVTYRDTTDRVREMRALEAAEREKEAILDGLSDLICVSEPNESGEFVITYANRAYLAFMGLNEGEVLGRPRSQFQLPEHARMYDDVRDAAIAARGPVSRELAGELHGERRHANVLVTPFFDDDGRCTRTIWRITDLTEQRAAEAERDAILVQQSTILDGLSDFVYLLERDDAGEFRFVFANAGVDHNIDIETEVIGKRLQDLPGFDGVGARPLGLIEKSVEARAPVDGRFVARPNGRDRILDVRVTPLVEPDGSVRRVIWRATDLTDRELSGRRLQALATANLDPFSILEPVHDAEGTVVDYEFRYSNQAGAELNRRYAVVDQPGRLSEIFGPAPEGLAAEMARYNKVMESGEPMEHQLRTRAADGSVRWLWRQIIPVEEGVLVTGRDVTESRQSEAAIAAAESLLRETLDGLTDPISVSDRQPDGRWKMVAANEAFAAHIGRPLPDIVGLYVEQYIPNERLARNDRLRETAIRRREPIEEEFEQRSGDVVRTRLVRVIPLFDDGGECYRTIWRSTDVTALRATRSQFEAAADVSTDSFMLMKPVYDDGQVVDMRITFANEHARARFATWPAGAPGTLRELVQEGDPAFGDTLAVFGAVLENQLPWTGEVTRELNGEVHSYWRQVLPLDDAVAVSYRDTTEERRQNRALEEAEANHRAILDGLADAVVVADRQPGGTFPVTYANRAFFELLGLDPADVYGRRAADFLEPTANAVADDAFTTLLAGREPVTRELRGEVGGRELTLSALITPVFDGAGELVRVIWRLTDMTGQRAIEHRFRAAAEANLAAMMIIEPERDGAATVTDFTVTFANEAARRRFANANPNQEVQKISDIFAARPDRFATVLDLYRKTLESGIAYEDEVHSTTPGPDYWYARQISPFQGGLVVTHRETTRERQAQQELVAAERNQRAILHGLADAVVVSDRDPEGNYPITYANPAFFKLLGVSADEVVDKGAASFLPAEIAEAVVRTRFEAIEAGEPIERQISGVVRGRALNLEARITPVFNDDGVCERLIWRLNDLSALWKRHDLAQAAERDLRTILESLTDGIIVTDRDEDGDFRVSYIHPVPAMANRMNYDSMIGKTWLQLFPSGEGQLRVELTAQVIESRTPADFDTKLEQEGHDPLHLAGRASPVFNEDGGCDRIVWRYSDMTDAYRHQREIAAAEANQRAILEGLTDGIVVTDRAEDGEFRISYAHPLLAVADIFSPERVMGFRFSDLTGFFVPEQLAIHLAAQERALESRVPVDFDASVVTAGGRTINESGLVTPVLDADGQCSRLIWRFTDVTQTERDQLRLREAERNYRGIIETIDDGLLVFDRDGTGTFRVTFSRPLAVLAGWLGDVLGKSPEELWQGERLESRLAHVANAIASHRPIDFETNIVADGELVYELARVTPVFNDAGYCTRLVWRFTDVTEMYATQRQLEVAERNQRGILDGISDSLYVLDKDANGDFRFSYANEAALRSSYSTVAIGQTIEGFMEPREAAPRAALMRRVSDTGVAETIDLPYREQSGEGWLSISASPVLSGDGECRRIIWRVTDVTNVRAQQARIEANERFQDAILSGLRDYIFVLDRDQDGEFRYSYLNDAAREMNAELDSNADPIGLRVDDVMGPGDAAIRNAMFDEAIRTRSSVGRELSRPQRDGRIMFASSVVTPVLEPDGRCNRLILRATDTTAVREQQRLIEENERNWRAILDAMTDVLVVLDREPGADFRVTYINAAREAVTGRPDDQLLGKRFDEFLQPEGARRLARAVDIAITGRRFVDFEGVTPDVNGEALNYAARITPVYEADDDCRRVILRYTDITNTRRTEQRLEQSEQDRDTIVQSLADIVLLFDCDDDGDFRLSYANPPFFETGRTTEQTMGRRFSDFLLPEEAQARDSMLAEAIATRTPVERELTTLVNGRLYNYTTRVSPIFDGDTCVRATWRYTDISELVRNRERLEASEAEQRAVLDGLSDAVFMVEVGDDGHWTIVRTNRAHLELTGLTREELQGHTLESLAEQYQLATQSLRLLHEAVGSGGIVEEESNATFTDHEIVVVRRVTPLFDERGRIHRCIFRISDVTEARRREAMVNRLGRVMDGASDEILIIDGATLAVVQTNRAARENLGYDEDEITGLPAAVLMIDGSDESVAEVLAPLRNGETNHLQVDGAVRRKDGTTYPIEARVQLLEHESSPVYVATVRDVTQRRALEQSVARLAAIVESSADAVMSVDADGTVGHWNRAAESMFGIPASEAVGLTPASLFADDTDTGIVLELAHSGGTADAVLHARDGKRLDVSMSAFAVQAPSGRDLGTAIIARDIRWRVEAMHALQESERRFRSIFDEAPEGILIQRASDGVMLDINQRLLEMIEFPRDAVLGTRPIDLGVVASPEVVMALDRELLGGATSAAPRELALKTSGGKVVETLVTVQVIELNGERCFLSFLNDVTHLRETERSLLAAEEGLRSITQNLPVILIAWDEEDRCTLATGLGLQVAGLDGEALLGHHMNEIIGPSTQLDSTMSTAKPGDTGSLEFSIGGRIFEAQFRVLPDDSTVAVAVDVTEARTTLRQIDAIVENMPITFVAFDADGIVTVVRGAGGISIDESAIGKPVVDVYRQRQGVVDDIHRVLSGERVSATYLREDGRSHEVHYNPIRTVDGNLAGAAVVIIDITDRISAEQAVAESNERFRQMAESATDGIVSANRRGRIVFANEAMTTIFGYGVDELVGQPLTMLMPHGLASSHRTGFSRYHETGQKNLNWQSLELTGRRKDGVEFTIEMSMSEAMYDGEPVITAFVRDITERRRTEEALMQAQKLESLGVLAGGIAHDFNNMLVAIMGNAGLALSELQAESPAYETVQEIELAARRAAELARQMLAYSGKGRLTVNTVDLTALVEEIPHLLRTSIGKGVTLRYDLGRNIPAVEADATQLRQVVMNLVINASDAIGQDEGVIAISTGVIDANRDYLRSVYIPGEPKPGRYCYLDVRDTGSGMSQETLAKIFDPFFTTKFTGKGLGLAAVLGIVRGHKGTIKVESSPGQGTTFRLLLPATDGTAQQAVAQANADSQWRGQGTVLVVDDEDSVRHVTGRALKMMGFDVIEAEDGQVGFDLFREQHESIACVLMDMTMPRMNGETAARKMRELDSAVPIILMSGFDEGEMATRFRDAGMAGFVQKPYEIRTLREALRQATGRAD